MQTIEYWEVTESYDRDVTHIGNFANAQSGNHLANKSMYYSVDKRTLTIFDSIEDFDTNTREKIRQRALTKLTLEEKIALGVQ